MHRKNHIIVTETSHVGLQKESPKRERQRGRSTYTQQESLGHHLKERTQVQKSKQIP